MWACGQVGRPTLGSNIIRGPGCIPCKAHAGGTPVALQVYANKIGWHTSEAQRSKEPCMEVSIFLRQYANEYTLGNIYAVTPTGKLTPCRRSAGLSAWKFHDGMHLGQGSAPSKKKKFSRYISNIRSLGYRKSSSKLDVNTLIFVMVRKKLFHPAWGTIFVTVRVQIETIKV